MTRRPILIGTAAVLALILTAGLAYGSGRQQNTHPRHTQFVQVVRTHMNPGYGWNHQGQGSRHGSTAGNHNAWMGNYHNRHVGSWGGMLGGHRNATHYGYRYDHHYGSPRGAGTYDRHKGSFGGSHGDGDWHGCW